MAERGVSQVSLAVHTIAGEQYVRDPMPIVSPDCPVCGSGPGVWLHYPEQTVAFHRCDECGLFECHEDGRTRTGFVRDEKFRYMGYALVEARALSVDPERHTIEPETDEDHTAWLVYADWLDEHDYPENAKAVRSRHGLHGDATERPTIPGEAREADVLPEAGEVPE